MIRYAVSRVIGQKLFQAEVLVRKSNARCYGLVILRPDKHIEIGNGPRHLHTSISSAIIIKLGSDVHRRAAWLGNVELTYHRGHQCRFVFTKGCNNLHNIGKIHSENARRHIESEFGLVRAQDHKREIFELKPLAISPLQYGRAETKQAISAVLQSVIDGYQFSSLTELNAVLGQYRIFAMQILAAIHLYSCLRLGNYGCQELKQSICRQRPFPP